MGLVQSPVGVTSTGTGSVAPTCSAATAGNILVAKVAWNESVTNTDVNTPSGWTAMGQADIDNASNVRGRMFKKVAAGGETGVTITSVSGTPDMAAYIEEWSALDSAGAEDTMRNELSGSTAPPGTGAIASPGAGDIATGFIAIKNNNSLNTPTNSYTLVGTVVSGNATAANQVRLASVYNLSPGATDVQLTEGGTARPFVGQVYTMKPAAGLTLSVTAGRLDFSGTGPTFSTSMAAVAGRLDFQATGPSLSMSMAATAGRMDFAATGPKFSASLQTVAGRLDFAATGPKISMTMPAVAGVISFAGTGPALSVSITLPAVAGRITIAATGPFFSLALSLPVTAGQIAILATGPTTNIPPPRYEWYAVAHGDFGYGPRNPRYGPAATVPQRPMPPPPTHR